MRPAFRSLGPSFYNHLRAYTNPFRWESIRSFTSAEVYGSSPEMPSLAFSLIDTPKLFDHLDPVLHCGEEQIEPAGVKRGEIEIDISLRVKVCHRCNITCRSGNIRHHRHDCCRRQIPRRASTPSRVSQNNIQ